VLKTTSKAEEAYIAGAKDKKKEILDFLRNPRLPGQQIPGKIQMDYILPLVHWIEADMHLEDISKLNLWLDRNKE
jgi:hypothetical protein